jgi:hypothetical protein
MFADDHIVVVMCPVCVCSTMPPLYSMTALISIPIKANCVDQVRSLIKLAACSSQKMITV